MNSDATTSDLVARQEITELMYRYCRSVDRLDIPLGHSIWHDNGVADYGADVYQGDGRGVIDHICAQHLHTLHHSHQMSNILIQLDGERASSESYVTAWLRMRRGEQLMQITVWSRYIDRWSRREGRWALDHRLAVRDFDEIRAVTATKDHQVGRRDLSDPSYGVLK